MIPRRRALRHAFTLLSALSLLMCALVCGLWLRSYRVSDNFDRYGVDPAKPPTFSEMFGVFTRPGALGFGYVRLDHPTQTSWPHTSTRWLWSRRPPLTTAYKRQWAWGGFERWDERWGPRGSIFGAGVARGFQIPLWAIALSFAIAPLAWLRHADLRSRKAKRLQAGQCPACGYDLRGHCGSATGRRCPECGAGIA